MDVIIFSGQSNMQGQTEALPSPNEPVDGALEYKFATDSLVPLLHPCGEDLGGDARETCPIQQAWDGHGSIVPDFCREYVRLTGRRVCAVHDAKGGTAISEWQKNGDENAAARYKLAVAKMNAAIAKARETEGVGRVFLLWLQGESDAIYRTPPEEYKRMMIAFKDDLKRDVGIERFGIIGVGYFAGVVSWLGDRTREEGLRDDDIIIRAQDELCREDADFAMLTTVCREFSLRQEMISPLAEGHYNNDAMTLIGRYAARALWAHELGETLETERLLLRPWREDDAEDCFKYAKDERVGPIAGWPAHKDIGETMTVIREILCAPETYAIVWKQSGEVIGSVSLMMRGVTDLTDRDDECELGYWIGAPWWGQGIMPEAAGELLRRAFEDLGMRAVWCGYYEGNDRSKRVQEKLGFAYHHTTRDLYVKQVDEYRTGIANLLTREAWEK